MNRFWFSLLLSFSFAIAARAQDATFTQFYSTPLELNPALTGGFDGRYRFSLAYRDQNRRAAEHPYNTIAAALDLRFPVGFNASRQEDGAGVGLMFLTDRVPTTGYNTTKMGIFGAYHKSLDENNNQYLSAGIQLSLNQRGININSLTFEDQFNGSSGFFEPTAESFENTFAFFDLGLGLNYSYAPTRKVSIFIGGAVNHILEPQISFFFDRQERNDELGNNVLQRRFTGHLGARFPLTKTLQLLPRVNINSQGPHMAINAGTNIRIALGQYTSSAFHVGGWVRPVTTIEEDLELAAGIFMVGFETNNVLFGFSYDLSLSEIVSVRSTQSAFEFTVAYLGNYDDDLVLCPEF